MIDSLKKVQLLNFSMRFSWIFSRFKTIHSVSYCLFAFQLMKGEIICINWLTLLKNRIFCWFLIWDNLKDRKSCFLFFLKLVLSMLTDKFHAQYGKDTHHRGIQTMILQYMLGWNNTVLLLYQWYTLFECSLWKKGL